MTFESAETSVNIALVGVCLFAAHLLLLRRRDPGVYLPLALLFLFQGGATGLALLTEAYDPPSEGVLSRINLLGGGLEVAIPFLFWVYVRALTTEGEVARVPRLSAHIALIAFVALCFWSLLLLPADIATADLGVDDARLAGAALVILAAFIADILFKIMVGAYLYLTVRRLITYQARLKDVFASTEDKELTWVWVIAGSAAFYLLLNIALTALLLFGVFAEDAHQAELSFLHSAAVLALFWVIGVWGLRQRPGLVRPTAAEQPEPDLPPAQKYERSALDDDRAQRIAQKIETAMSRDLIYRDPNLSLWDLATHIGVTSHYVSQTLNTHLGKSFFELVNGWRIRDAVKQLTTTDATILVIAYDVGFNSRSAFYKAFKREIGKTPSDLRR